MEEYTPQKQENEERMEAASPSMCFGHIGDAIDLLRRCWLLPSVVLL